MNNEALPPLPLPLPFASGQNIAFPPVALWVTVGLAVCLLVLLIALAAVCRRKIKESCEEARREGKSNGGGSAHYSHKEYNSLTMTLLEIHVKSSRLDKSMCLGCLAFIRGNMNS